MSHDSPDAVTPTRTVHIFAVTGDPVVQQQMGNGMRRIHVHHLEVTVYGDPYRRAGHVSAEGRSILRDGTLGPVRMVGWTVDPRPGVHWDQSADIPGWAMEIAAPLIAGEAALESATPNRVDAARGTRRADAAEQALATVHALARQIGDEFGDRWPHNTICLGDGDDGGACPLCQILALTGGDQ